MAATSLASDVGLRGRLHPWGAPAPEVAASGHISDVAHARRTILLVEDEESITTPLAEALERDGFHTEVAHTVADGLAKGRSARPDLVLLDIGLPDRSGIAVGKDILEERPGTSVVALTALDDGRLVKDAMRAGFAGYLTKDVPSHHFVRSLESIVDGHVVVSQKFAKAANGNADHAGEVLARLTDRERQVLSLLADGAGSETIAKAMSITLNTARTHVQNVLTKLQVHSRLEAATFAVRHGLLDATKGNRLH